MKTVCELNMCNGCMACVEKCHRNAITIKDDLKYYNALVDTKKCVDCGLCTKVCPRENDNDMSKPKWWYQGWADSEIRETCFIWGCCICNYSRIYKARWICSILLV